MEKASSSIIIASRRGEITWMPENARACASNYQQKVVKIYVPSNTSIIGLGTNAKIIHGNLVLGDESISRYLALTSAPPAPIPEPGIADAYATLAENAMQGEAPGSSAGGEQPKFTTLVERGGRP